MTSAERKARAKALAKEITAFDCYCNQQGYTDIDDVWTLLYRLRTELRKLGR